ncbi:HTH_Tnp_Tc3_2 domain-containing protein [Trichonephila clavipes]|uniref:HTH_Tnp_Tc3_2 domain-containing protein n=1 Tax=Trichonephila clavipes TaxID=2585209 RepID=A0A8X6S2L4_TRICX|nr:HTH_Tnp_Tc3_2 domain-containing protein [Trichonephila clavipes]
MASYCETKGRTKRFNQGRLRATTSAKDRYLSLCARKNRTATLAELTSFLAASSGRLESRINMRHKLHVRDLYARRSAISVALILRYQWESLQSELQHVQWTRDPWMAALLTEESRFSLESDSRRIFIWRESGTRFHP